MNGQTYNLRNICFAGHDARCPTLGACKEVQSGPKTVVGGKLHIQGKCQSPEVLISDVQDWSVFDGTKTGTARGNLFLLRRIFEVLESKAEIALKHCVDVLDFTIDPAIVVDSSCIAFYILS